MAEKDDDRKPTPFEYMGWDPRYIRSHDDDSPIEPIPDHANPLKPEGGEGFEMVAMLVPAGWADDIEKMVNDYAAEHGGMAFKLPGGPSSAAPEEEKDEGPRAPKPY